MKTTYQILFRGKRDEHRPLRLRLRGPGDHGVEPMMDAPEELGSEVIDVATGELCDRRGRARR
jgi:hypothetical protein